MRKSSNSVEPSAWVASGNAISTSVAIHWGQTLSRIAVVWMMLLLAACNAPPPPKERMIGVGITGIDHLADHLSVQDFSVDGYDAAQAGGGGGTVCCAMLPAKWRPDLSVRVDWVEQNWRDCSYRERHRQVPVEQYQESGQLWVHFLSDDRIRVVVSNPGPGNPAYPGPHDPIPHKSPWHDYPAEEHCHRQWKEIKEP